MVIPLEKRKEKKVRWSQSLWRKYTKIKENFTMCAMYLEKGGRSKRDSRKCIPCVKVDKRGCFLNTIFSKK